MVMRRKQKGSSKIINIFEFVPGLSLRRKFISFHKTKNLFKKRSFFASCAVLRIIQRRNFNMYAQELISRGQAACLPIQQDVGRLSWKLINDLADFFGKCGRTVNGSLK